jgi:hypothetical protein
MKRRDIIALVSGAAAWPLSAHAQQMPKVTDRSFDSPCLARNSAGGADLDVIRQGFTQLGYVEGQNIILERRAKARSGFYARDILRSPNSILPVCRFAWIAGICEGRTVDKRRANQEREH